MILLAEPHEPKHKRPFATVLPRAKAGGQLPLLDINVKNRAVPRPEVRGDEVHPSRIADFVLGVFGCNRKECRECHQLPRDEQEHTVLRQDGADHAGRQQPVEEPQPWRRDRVVTLAPVGGAENRAQGRNQEHRHQEDGAQHVQSQSHAAERQEPRRVIRGLGAGHETPKGADHAGATACNHQNRSERVAAVQPPWKERAKKTARTHESGSGEHGGQYATHGHPLQDGRGGAARHNVRRRQP
jgi:hypothetical protein